MTVYRITLEKYSQALLASGYPARWNSKDVKMIYTASSRALACLENVVHRSGLGLQERFRTLVIEIPDDISQSKIDSADLVANWHRFEQYPYTRHLGDAWIAGGASAILQVPSAIIPEEFNYLLNPAHPEFSRIKLLRTERFEFDPRIKG